ncbi:MAG: hypothetical protein EPO61_15750 [Nitrospirae bacterium]|nr:MAG: hypothetical protein EPO61_15750 [Nitrospirota bacterium]
MYQQQLESPYRRYLDLLDRGAKAIEREDLEALEAVAAASALVLAEMRDVLADLEAQAVTGGLAGEEAALESLGLLMRDAINRSERNQERITAWKAQTQEWLCTAKAGSVAMAGYAGVALHAQGMMHTQG